MQDTAVLVASGNLSIRQVLVDMVRGEPGFRLVGEASSEVEARALARQLEPEAVLVDFHLPHTVGLESVRLSRMSGLDTAMAIADERRGTRVVLLTNLDAALFRGKGVVGGIARRLLTEIGGIRRALTLRELCVEVPQAVAAPVFADVEVSARALSRGMSAKRALRGVGLAVGAVVVLVPTVFLLTLMAGAVLLAITQ